MHDKILPNIDEHKFMKSKIQKQYMGNPLFTKKINIFFSHKNGNVSPTKVRNLSKSR